MIVRRFFPTSRVPRLAEVTAVLALAALAVIAGTYLPGKSNGVPVPEGYRLGQYRAPTPNHVPGAVTVDTAAVRRLVDSGALSVDVQPEPATGEPARRHIPDSLWLPGAGYGTLSRDDEVAFMDRLREASDGKGLVFYCLADCWLSWNAARRAVALGFEMVYWYPAGTDGWREARLPLVDAELPWPAEN